MYEEQFPHEEFPNGIIRLSEQKFVRVRNLMRKYMELGFNEFNLVEMAGLSLSQWKRRDYPVPNGFKRHRSKIFIKIPQDELDYQKIIAKKAI